MIAVPLAATSDAAAGGGRGSTGAPVLQGRCPLAPEHDLPEGRPQLADQVLGEDGCLNFFAGPTDNRFSAEINFYDVHYAGHHVVGVYEVEFFPSRQAVEYRRWFVDAQAVPADMGNRQVDGNRVA